MPDGADEGLGLELSQECVGGVDADAVGSGDELDEEREEPGETARHMSFVLEGEELSRHGGVCSGLSPRCVNVKQASISAW